MSRLLKQLAYGGTFLAIVFGTLSFIVYANLKPVPSCFDRIQNQEEEGVDCGGPCSLSCERVRLTLPNISPVYILETADDAVSLLVELRNTNANFGLPRFTYQTNLYAVNGEVISTFLKESFIYPGEIKFLIEPAVPVARTVARATVEILGVTPESWRSGNEFFAPPATTRDVRFEESEERGELYISGLVVNGSGEKISRVTVNAILVNPFGLYTNFSQTFLQDIRAAEERFFRVTIPRVDFSNYRQSATKIYLELEQ